MFENDLQGYSKQDIEKFVKKLRADYEAKLMEEKLKVLEAEKKVLDYKNKSYELENREKNIMSALDMFRRYQDEGSRNIDALRMEQFRMIQEELILLFKELSLQYKGIQNNRTLLKILKDMDTVLKRPIQRKDMTSPTNTENDSMRILLNKLQGTRRQENPKEIKIQRTPFDDRKSQIKPVTDMKLEEGDKFTTLADKFLSTRPDDSEKLNAPKIQSSGFDLKEAINPKEDLAEIMKAFDFFNNDEE